MKPIRFAIYIALSVMFLTTVACGRAKNFDLAVTMPGNPTMNVRIVYAGEDALNNVVTAVRDGKLEFAGDAPGGTTVYILDNNWRRLGFAYAANGDKIKMYLDPRDPWLNVIGGNAVNDSITAWLKANRGLRGSSPAKTNAAVAKYVKSHGGDIASAVIFNVLYDASADPGRAMKVYALIDPQARAAAGQATAFDFGNSAVPARVKPIRYLTEADTFATFDPHRRAKTLLVLTNNAAGRTDSILPRLRTFYEKKGAKSFLDLRLEGDTMSWRRAARNDSLPWRTGWVAGSVAAPGLYDLDVPSLPYFIVTDSAGRQTYRGRSLTKAIEAAGGK